MRSHYKKKAVGVFKTLGQHQYPSDQLDGLSKELSAEVNQYFSRYGIKAKLPSALEDFSEISLDTDLLHSTPDGLSQASSNQSSSYVAAHHTYRSPSSLESEPSEVPSALENFFEISLDADGENDLLDSTPGNLPKPTVTSASNNRGFYVAEHDMHLSPSSLKYEQSKDLQLFYGDRAAPIGNLKVTYVRDERDGQYKLKYLDSSTHFLRDLTEQEKRIDDEQLVQLCCDCAEAEQALADTLEKLDNDNVKKSLGRRVLNAVMETGRNYSKRRLPVLIATLKEAKKIVLGAGKVGEFLDLAKKMNRDAWPRKITGALMMFAGVALILTAVVLGYFTAGLSFSFILSGVPVALFLSGLALWKTSETEASKAMRRLAATEPPVEKKSFFEKYMKRNTLEPSRPKRASTRKESTALNSRHF
jgi:hypothetical protein